MFDIGFWELALIGVIALLVIGPERLPGVARNVGVWVAQARRYVAHVKRDIERELHAEEVRQLLDKPEGLDDLRSIAREAASVFDETRRELDATANNLRDSASAPAHALGSGAGDAKTAPATHGPATHSVADKAPATHSVADKAPATHSVADKAPPTHSVADKAPPTHSVADKAPATHGVAGQAADDDLLASASSARVSPAGGDAAPGDSPVQPSAGDLTQHDEKSAREKSARQGQR